MKIAVITPYHDIESPYFTQCLESIKNQTYQDVIHITIGDGCNQASLANAGNTHNIHLPKNLNDYGDSPRSIGVIYAFSLGVDAVVFLDSDNWYEPNHIETMVNECIASNSDVVTSLRYLNHLNGSVMGVCPDSNGIGFCDTNCLLVTKAIAEEAGVWWLIPDDLHVIDDRVIWDTLIHATDKISSTGKPTIHYRTAFLFHYQTFNIPPPKGTKAGEHIATLGEIMNSLQLRAQKRFDELKYSQNTTTP